MHDKNKFYDLFKVKKPIIGIIHLSGSKQNKINKAIDELILYDEEGVNGAIIEDYHGEPEDVIKTLKEIKKNYDFNLVIGANILRNPYLSFNSKDLGAKFAQFDSVQSNHLDVIFYDTLRKKHPDMTVLGGVRFKYRNNSANPLEEDLNEGMSRCDAIVTTGEGTGIETPIEKLKQFKGYMKDFPLIVGAGVTLENCLEQMQVADGAIVGSYFKQGGKDTKRPVDKYRVKHLVSAVKELRDKI